MVTDRWRDNAACRGRDPALFFPEHGNRDQQQAARAICAGCPVQAPCLQYALTTRLNTGKQNGTRLVGVWAGTGANKRAKLRRAAGIT